MGILEIMGIVVSVLILFIGHLAFTLHLINGLKSDMNSLKSDMNSLKSDMKSYFEVRLSDMKDYFEARLKAELVPINNQLSNHITDTNKRIDALEHGQKEILKKLDDLIKK